MACLSLSLCVFSSQISLFSVCVFSLVRTRPLSSFIQHVLSVFSILFSSLRILFHLCICASICHPSLPNKPNYFSISLIRDPLLCFLFSFCYPLSHILFALHHTRHFHFPVISNFSIFLSISSINPSSTVSFLMYNLLFEQQQQQLTTLILHVVSPFFHPPLYAKRNTICLCLSHIFIARSSAL